MDEIESLSQVLLVDGEGPGDSELVPPEAAVHPLRRLGRVGERPPRRLAQDVLPRVRLRERVYSRVRVCRWFLDIFSLMVIMEGINRVDPSEFYAS